MVRLTVLRGVGMIVDVVRVRVFALGFACACGTKGDGSGASTGEGTATTSTVGTTGTAGVECEDLQTEAECNGMQSLLGLPCEWFSFRAVERTGDVCTDLPEVEMCVELTGWTTAAGCGSWEPQCPEFVGEAYYRQLEGGPMLLFVGCGGSPPSSFDGCESILYDAQPPECACACPTFPNYGVDTGTGSGSTGSTG